MTSLSTGCANRNSRSTLVILSASILSASLLIFGPALLSTFNPTSHWSEKTIVLVSNIPAWFIFIWIISPPNNFISCQYQAWKKRRAAAKL